MTTTSKKKKLCWNCEANVDWDAENCIYCGVYLYPENNQESVDFTVEEVEAPYKEGGQQEKIPTSPYSTLSEEEMEPTEEDFVTQVKKERGDVKGVVLPILFLLSGILFFLFGILMYLFQQDGVFTLKWNANYWFIYLFFSAPLMFIGWRTLKYIEEQDE